MRSLKPDKRDDELSSDASKSSPKNPRIYIDRSVDHDRHNVVDCNDGVSCDFVT